MAPGDRAVVTVVAGFQQFRDLVQREAQAPLNQYLAACKPFGRLLDQQPPSAFPIEARRGPLGLCGRSVEAPHPGRQPHAYWVNAAMAVAQVR